MEVTKAYEGSSLCQIYEYDLLEDFDKVEIGISSLKDEVRGMEKSHGNQVYLPVTLGR